MVDLLIEDHNELREMVGGLRLRGFQSARMKLIV